MRLAIHSDRRDEMNAIDETSISERNIIKMSSQRKISEWSEILNKINKIVKLYEFKEINVSEMMSIADLYNLFDIIKAKTRQDAITIISSTRNDNETLMTRLKKIIDRLEKIA